MKTRWRQASFSIVEQLIEILLDKAREIVAVSIESCLRIGNALAELDLDYIPTDRLLGIENGKPSDQDFPAL